MDNIELDLKEQEKVLVKGKSKNKNIVIENSEKQEPKKGVKKNNNDKKNTEDDIDDIADGLKDMDINKDEKVTKCLKKHIECDKVKDIIYVGDIIKKNTKSLGKWMVDYKCSKEIMKKEKGRIYFIVIDGQIYKIGSSACKGGIKSTFSFYEGGLGGSPSIRSYGIHLLIQENLDNNKKIKVYMLFIEEIKIKIRGLTSEEETTTCPQINVMEEMCRKDYKNIYGKYPPWNFQENNEEWPEHIKNKYKEQVSNRGKKMMI